MPKRLVKDSQKSLELLLDKALGFKSILLSTRLEKKVARKYLVHGCSKNGLSIGF